MKYRIITISRESGSGGKTIGKEVARNLAIPFYDKDLINQIAGKNEFSTSIQDDPWTTQKHIIQKLA